MSPLSAIKKSGFLSVRACMHESKQPQFLFERGSVKVKNNSIKTGMKTLWQLDKKLDLSSPVARQREKTGG